MSDNRYYSGTSGLLLPVPNKEFYPESFKTKSRLCYYGSLFNSIEINSSFYKVPLKKTVSRWAEETPANFKFTFKLWREITHQKGLSFETSAVYDFIERISAIGNKKACLLVQFPASIKFTHFRQLTNLLDCIRSADPDGLWRLAVEFRDRSWYREETYELLEQYQAGSVLHDKITEGLQMTENGRDFIYVRFHGPNGDYKDSYNDDFLYEYASYIREWLAEGKQVYTYFNNTIGNAIGNLQILRNIVNEI